MMAFCLKKIDIIQFFTPTVLSTISLKYIKHCANTGHLCHVRQTYFYIEISTGPLREGKAEVVHPGSADSAREKERNTSHIYSHDSLHA